MQTSEPNRETARCPRMDDAATYVRGEMTPDERQAFEAHLADCAPCRAEEEAARSLLTRLQALPEVRVSRDLAAETLARIPDAEWERRPWRSRRWFAAAAAAAVFLLLAGGYFWLCRREAPASSAGLAQTPVEPARAAVQAVGWLCRSQEEDGSWSAAKWGGNRQFQPALTALALLAVLGDETNAVDPVQSAVAKRAAGCLVASQDAAGDFGEPFSGAPYNQGLATYALLRAYRATGNAAWRGPLDRAVEAICRRQHTDGGWGYQDEVDALSNLSITLWQVKALRAAAEFGWPQAKARAERGMRWIAGVTDDEGFFGYRQPRDFPEGSTTLTAMGAASVLDSPVDLLPLQRRRAIQVRLEHLAAQPAQGNDSYQRYFLSAALKRVGTDQALHLLKDLQQDIAHNQLQEGPLNGSWALNDRWSDTGGRIYTTTMAALALGVNQ